MPQFARDFAGQSVWPEALCKQPHFARTDVAGFWRQLCFCSLRLLKAVLAAMQTLEETQLLISPARALRLSLRPAASKASRKILPLVVAALSSTLGWLARKEKL